MREKKDSTRKIPRVSHSSTHIPTYEYEHVKHERTQKFSLTLLGSLEPIGGNMVHNSKSGKSKIFPKRLNAYLLSIANFLRTLVAYSKI